MTAFALGTFSTNGEAPFPGLVVDGRVLDLRGELGPETTTLALLEDWGASLVRLRDLAGAAPANGPMVDQLRPHPPVASRQVLCAGANYETHVREMAFAHFKAADDERADDELRADADAAIEQLRASDPYIFAGLPSALVGAHDDVVLWGPGTQHDWELELAVVISVGGRDIPVERAMEHVAGYTISNDVSTRDLLARPQFPMSDIVMTKCRPTFFPTGPYLVPRENVPELATLRLTLQVNDHVMQDSGLDDLMHGIDRLVAYASRAVELYPGDLLLTGSPAGNAAHHGGRWLEPGDVMHGEITGLGALHNRCVAPPT